MTLITLVHFSPFFASLGYFYYEFFGKLDRGEHGGSQYTWAKTVPILLLFLAALLQFRKKFGKVALTTLFAIVLSAIGDYLLANRSESADNMFKGTIAFGIAHVFFAMSYLKFDDEKPILWFVPGAIMIPINILVSLFVLPNVEDVKLRATFAIYGVFLMGSLWLAATEWKYSERKQNLSSLCRMIGYVVFFVSDTLIVLDGFHTPIPKSQLYIITTYYIAEFLIVLGNVLYERESTLVVVKHKKKH